jgi:hypothetical protein
MTPVRHWCTYGNALLPTGWEALDEPFSAISSLFMRIICDRCGKDRMRSKTYTPQRDMLIREIIKLMRHAGCGGRASKVELVSGIEAANSRPVRKIMGSTAEEHRAEERRKDGLSDPEPKSTSR